MKLNSHQELAVCLLVLAAATSGWPEVLAAAEPTVPELATLQAPGDKVTGLAFTPDGKYLAVGTNDKSLSLWQVETRARLEDLDVQGGAAHISVLFSPDGRTLFAGGVINFVVLWDVETGKRQAPWKGHERPVYALALSPDGKTLASGSRDFTIKLWDVATGEVRATIADHADAVESLAFSPDGETLASGSRDMLVKLWDPETGKEKVALQGHTGWVRGVAFAPDGKTLASASLDKSVKLWNVATLTHRTLTGDSSMSCVAFSPDGKTVLTGSGVKIKPGVIGQSHGELTLWDTATTEPRATLRDFPGQVTTLAFSPDGKILATGSSDGVVKLWNTAELLAAE